MYIKSNSSPISHEGTNKKDLDCAVKMGILEDVSGKANHDLWLAPMIVVPKKTTALGVL